MGSACNEWYDVPGCVNDRCMQPDAPSLVCPQQLSLAPLSPASSSSSVMGWNSEPSIGSIPSTMESPWNLPMSPSPFDPQAFDRSSRFLSPESELSEVDYLGSLGPHDTEFYPHDSIPQLSYTPSPSSPSSSSILSTPPPPPPSHQNAQQDLLFQNYAASHRRRTGRSQTSEPLSRHKNECPHCGRIVCNLRTPVDRKRILIMCFFFFWLTAKAITFNWIIPLWEVRSQGDWYT